ncbi:hypothetical protein [Clostridium sp. KNHs214]|uniref:hypothetical protein n=1 Tax=Clostridium sp. KNHs214 TaxID=1540257 RepID=UPI000558FC7F|nr:hypothetical protein [Clostridium sp. KNHs214]
MLKVSLLVMVLRGMPELYLMFVLMYILDHKPINRFKIMLSTIIMSAITYFVRFLPIHFGVHTIIAIAFNIIFAVYINKISPIKVMSSALIGAIMLFLCEGINLWIVQRFFNVSFSQGSIRTLREFIFSLPALFLFLIIIFIWKKMFNEEEVCTSDSKNM